MAAPFLVEQFERQQRRRAFGAGIIFRARVVGLLNELLEVKAGEQRQEQKDAGDASTELQRRREV